MLSFERAFLAHKRCRRRFTSSTGAARKSNRSGPPSAGSASRPGLPAKAFRPRILQHTVGTELRRRRVPGWDVSAFLGHVKGEAAPTTENYAKFGPDFLEEPRKAIDEWMLELAERVPRMAAVYAAEIERRKAVQAIQFESREKARASLPQPAPGFNVRELRLAWDRDQAGSDASSMTPRPACENGGTPKGPAVQPLKLVGDTGFEPVTPPMSRSRNQWFFSDIARHAVTA